MQETGIRKKLHSIIDILPDKNIRALEPLIDLMAETEEKYWKPSIETDLNETEKAIIEAGEKEYRENPESFVLLEDIK